MRHMLRLEVSASAIAHNIHALRAEIGPDVLFCAVVKSNAYGHGVQAVWPAIAENADWLAVASADEAIELRELGYAGPLLMLFCARSCGVDTDAVALLADLIQRNVVLTVTDPADVELVKLAAMGSGTEAAVHLEMDSGMTRSGASPDHVLPILGTIAETSEIRLDGLYTHFATADEQDESYTRQQMDISNEVITISGANSSVVKHYSNSAAAVRFPEARQDMVRVGLMMYGWRPAPHIAPELDLRPALRLVSSVMQLHEVPRGTRVGYGLTHTCERPSRIGLVAGGYADGYLRSLSNRAVVGVGGGVAPVLGRVSMDQITVDLTDHPNVMVGDEVELIANDASAPNSVEGLARMAETIPYEILTRMDSHRVERILVDA
ncbi:MAG: alanine racemase [Kiritimatiellia bacterium]|nr:alanine racemase [Kiritimatiellia bacterium]